MKKPDSTRTAIVARAAGVALLSALVIAGPTRADERGGERGRERPGERGGSGQRDGDVYRSPHWELDQRYRHDHYYPARGYVVPRLPPTHYVIDSGGGRFFYSAGVWFRGSGQRFVVVAPPLGIPVPVLPPSYATVWIGGRPYYYANDVYYAPAPGDGGYAVVAPPPGYESAIAQQQQPVMQPPPMQPRPVPVKPSAPMLPLPPPPVPGYDDWIVYPRNGQSATQTLNDRNECRRWAASQVGYDGGPPNPGDQAGAQRWQDFQRASAACLEGRGYTVR